MRTCTRLAPRARAVKTLHQTDFCRLRAGSFFIKSSLFSDYLSSYKYSPSWLSHCLLDDNGQVHAGMDRAIEVVGARRAERAKRDRVVVERDVVDPGRSRLHTRHGPIVGAPGPIGEGMRDRAVVYDDQPLALMEGDDIRGKLGGRQVDGGAPRLAGGRATRNRRPSDSSDQERAEDEPGHSAHRGREPTRRVERLTPQRLHELAGAGADDQRKARVLQHEEAERDIIAAWMGQGILRKSRGEVPHDAE